MIGTGELPDESPARSRSTGVAPGRYQAPGQTRTCPRPPGLAADPSKRRLSGQSAEIHPPSPGQAPGRKSTRPTPRHDVHTPPQKNLVGQTPGEAVNYPTDPPHTLKIELNFSRRTRRLGAVPDALESQLQAVGERRVFDVERGGGAGAGNRVRHVTEHERGIGDDQLER